MGPDDGEEREVVRFVLDGQTVSVRNPAPGTTLMSFLRLGCGRTGTKEGCAEGDCGACTVVIGELKRGTQGERIAWRAINSCIRFLPTVDGREIVTVESLRDENGALHPVQKALVERHASQCGFCTPGFVMSVFALYLNQPMPERADVLDAIAGNLCRCTGYRPIIDAALDLKSAPEPRRWSRADAQSAQRREQLARLQRKQSLCLTSPPGFVAPRTSDELAAALEAAPASLILAGATDIGLWVTKQLRGLPPLVYIGEIAELKEVREIGGGLQIGAGVPLTEAFEAIVARWPALAELANRFAAPPIRNSGTLCGNIANGSPIGDSMPALIALDAKVELRRGTRRRMLTLDQLYVGYQTKALDPGEFVAAVTIPLPRRGQRLASYKVSKRFDQDISTVCSAYAVEISDGEVTAARIAHGGMAAVPQRALRAETAFIGKPWTLRTVEAAAEALAADYQPISDMRSTSAYRLQVAQNLLLRFFHEQNGSGMPTRIAEVEAQ